MIIGLCILTVVPTLVSLQLRTIAEAAMHELQSKVKEREEQLLQLTAKLQEHQAAYLQQHAKDRAEIEALSNKLFESGAASIAGLKVNLAKASAALAATGDGGEEVRLGCGAAGTCTERRIDQVARCPLRCSCCFSFPLALHVCCLCVFLCFAAAVAV